MPAPVSEAAASEGDLGVAAGIGVARCGLEKGDVNKNEPGTTIAKEVVAACRGYRM